MTDQPCRAIEIIERQYEIELRRQGAFHEIYCRLVIRFGISYLKGRVAHHPKTLQASRAYDRHAYAAGLLCKIKDDVKNVRGGENYE